MWSFWRNTEAKASVANSSKKPKPSLQSLGCCKLTLEVLEGNKLAQAAYIANGFAGYQLDPEMGQGDVLAEEALSIAG